VEIGSLWGMDASRVRKELNVALYLCEHAEAIWHMCLSGQLDGYRASLIADAARQKLDTAERVSRFMTQMLKFLRKQLQRVDGDPDAEPLVTCTVRQLRNAIDYAVRKLQPPREEEVFRRAHAARTAYARDDAPGMGWLSVNGRIDQVKLADHRLLLAARRKRGVQHGDVLHGVLRQTADPGALGHGGIVPPPPTETGSGGSVPVDSVPACLSSPCPRLCLIRGPPSRR